MAYSVMIGLGKHNPRGKLTRSDYNWVPDVDDDNDYVWRGGYWQVMYDDDWTDEDEAALDDYEENKRRWIAEGNEY